MIGKIRGVAAISAVALLAAANVSVAQNYPDLTGYKYTYYADAAKTQYQGEVYDYGCGESAGYVYVVRVYVPSAYFDLEPIFTCESGQIGPIGP
ncbi:hypothetical protein N0B44_18740 [Roseibacterium beibuensis]|uniref:hypothetical protein n=1 Tax=[Roseibacterium] beibuensis TaxID=1193142 RepID=UPI00217EE8B4|nr:hypothetical protein [Roseibacterium beibuensis]MCS6624955.1 hypothetical protein [Roseibacterium beibuensis]